jgi:hypothetical protein
MSDRTAFPVVMYPVTAAPCTALKAIRTPMLGANMHTTVDAMKIAAQIQYVNRRP